MGITNLGKLIANNEQVYSGHTHAAKPNFINSYLTLRRRVIRKINIL